MHLILGGAALQRYGNCPAKGLMKFLRISNNCDRPDHFVSSLCGKSSLSSYCGLLRFDPVVFPLRKLPELLPGNAENDRVPGRSPVKAVLPDRNRTVIPSRCPAAERYSVVGDFSLGNRKSNCCGRVHFSGPQVWPGRFLSVRGERNGGAPLLVVFEKWVAGQPAWDGWFLRAGFVTPRLRRTRCRKDDESNRVHRSAKAPLLAKNARNGAPRHW